MLAYSDNAYDTIIPDENIVPHKIYKTVAAAEAVLKGWIEKLENFREVLYGKAYPYDKTTPMKELEDNGRALYGWTTVLDEDGDKDTFSIYIVAVGLGD